jgi:hypothetical protein
MGQLEKAAMAATLGSVNYLGNLPMMDGIANLYKVFETFPGQTPREQFRAMADHVGKVAAKATIGAAVPGQTLLAQVERYMDPRRSNTMADPELPPMVRGFYEALREQQARTPIASEGLLPSLDLWGRVRTQGLGQWWEFALPVRVSESPGEMYEIDKELIRLGMPIEMPDKKLESVGLTDAQYNRLLTLQATGIKDRGKDQIATLENLIASDEYQRLAPGEQIALLRRTHGMFLTAAKKQLLAEEPELAGKANDAKLNKDTTGHR